ncbi:MAG TPA: transglutaminase domain-containing protein, partial [Dehalococcoidia bacterium]|nr:transglutaminase domain-containing protein [Dehalococcoidia bacterium]
VESRPIARPTQALPMRWITGNWEDILTYLLALGMVLGVVFSVEQAELTRQMPALHLVAALAILAGLLLAHSPLRAYLAWPLAIVLGAAVCFWQALESVDGANISERVDVIYLRFEAWFHIAFRGGVSNDHLPFAILLVGVTWLGVFISAWALFRWHSAWIGIISGGVALFLNLAATGTGVSSAVFLYALCALLLLMRAHFTAQISYWRKENIPYPPLLSLSFLHLSLWVVGGLLLLAWLLPASGQPAIGYWQNLADNSTGAVSQFVRLAGPLKSSKITPIHDYTSVLPFSGSVKLRERELLSITLENTAYSGPILLRGAAYDKYSGGGWEVAERVDSPLSLPAAENLRQQLNSGAVRGLLLPMKVQVEAKSVVGTVLFSPGQPVAANIPAEVRLSRQSIVIVPFDNRPTDLKDSEILQNWLPPGLTGLAVVRDEAGGVRSVLAIDKTLLLPDSLEMVPKQRVLKGGSYRVIGFVPQVSSAELRASGTGYPGWVSERYLQLPSSLPRRVTGLARQVTAGSTNPYDNARAIESYLRNIPLNYKPGQTPAGKDAVDYFLFESKQGFFNHHASAMVVMLRSIGIPARLAVGFVIDEQSGTGSPGSYIVRDKNAYAWPEVFFPDYGWIEFNPTPGRESFTLLGDNPSGTGALSDPFALDSLFGDTDFTGLEDQFANALPDNLAPIALSDRGDGKPIALIVGMIAVIAILGSVFILAVWWHGSVAGLPYPQQVWEKLLRMAALAGHPNRPGQTVSEYAVYLGRLLEYQQEMRLLARLYNRSRFGGHAASTREIEQLTDAWKRLRSALVWEVFRLKQPRPMPSQNYMPWR